MSYCRWSSDNWKSDIYAYGHVDGYIAIHVAGLKRLGEIPELPDITKVSVEEFAAAYKVHHEALDKTELVPIGLPHDGKTFKEPTIEAAIERMKELKKAGYHVPDWAIEEMEDDANA